MRRLFRLIAPFGALFLCLVCPQLGTAQGVTLPVEVMGPAGTTVQVGLDTRAAAPAAALVLQVSGVEYPAEASVSVDGSAWLPIDNAHCRPDPESAAWGGIGGPIYTQTLTLPASEFGLRPDWLHVVSLRFNGTDGVSSGFRVLSMDLRDSNGDSLVTSRFRQADPARWTAPLRDPADVAAGRSLWGSGSLVAYPHGPPTPAHCADCHGADGRDLAYFGYSNHSIEVRSQFHGLTYRQGEQIASYIRSLPVAPVGRPWSPPYQPGPGLDQQPVSEWSGGAGLSAVLPDDASMGGYVLPAYRGYQYLDARETALPIPLPAWDQWLPRLWPGDYYPDFTASSYYQTWRQIDGRLATLGPAQLTAYLTPNAAGQAPISHDLLAWDIAARNWQMAHYDGPQHDGTWTAADSAGAQAVSQWRMVMEWEWMQRYGLEGQAPLVFATDLRPEPRGWLSGHAFGTAPASQHIPNAWPVGGSYAYQHYLDQAWYDLQLILQPRAEDIDWSYFGGVLANSEKLTQQPIGWQMVELSAKGAQDGWGEPPGTHLWGPEESTVWEQLVLWRGQFAGLDPATYAALLDGFAADFLSQGQRFTPAQLYGSGITTEYPAPRPDTEALYDATRETVYRGGALGMDGSLLSHLDTWGRTVWPAGGF